MKSDMKNIELGKGVRTLTLADQLPDCEISINEPIYDLTAICADKRVVDIGCGYGRNRALVESVGGEWIGVEPFEGGAHTVVATAEELPFAEASCDVVIMDAVLEHIPDVSRAFAEVGRVLKPGGLFVGYAAFMECFHEISYSHLSFKALENYAAINGMELTKIGGGGAFGIDYHLRVLLYPLPFGWVRKPIAMAIRTIFRIKAAAAFVALRYKRGLSSAEARQKAGQYYRLNCLRQSNGFSYVIQKNG